MKNQSNNKNLSENSPVSNSVKDNKSSTFSFNQGVTRSKNQTFKIRCESAAESTGLSKEHFYTKAEISRQRWYFWSWGLEPFPSYIKIKLCDLFGKPFRDLFLGEDQK